MGESPAALVRPRPLRRRMADEAIEVMAEQRANGLTPLPVHLMLVDDADERRTALACGNVGWGEWLTGDGTQVTCAGCLETVHA